MTFNDDQISAWLHGALTSDEAANMAATVAGDPDLSRRAAQLRRLDELVRQAVPLEDPLPAELLARLGLAARADADNVVDLAAARAERIELAPQKPPRFAAFAAGGWKVAAQVLIVLGIGIGAAQWANAPQPQTPDAAYRALGDAPSPAALAAAASTNALIMFETGTDAAEARAIAAKAGARISDMPTQAGAWRLSIDPARRDEVLEQLRALPEVRMAEPIDGAGQ